jgi:hypothetical protein
MGRGPEAPRFHSHTPDHHRRWVRLCGDKQRFPSEAVEKPTDTRSADASTEDAQNPLQGAGAGAMHPQHDNARPVPGNGARVCALFVVEIRCGLDDGLPPVRPEPRDARGSAAPPGPQGQRRMKLTKQPQAIGRQHVHGKTSPVSGRPKPGMGKDTRLVIRPRRRRNDPMRNDCGIPY